MTAAPVLPLSYRETVALLRKLQPARDRLVLVGGQALNYWAEHYRPRIPQFAAEAPFASKDIDFAGDRKTVQACAALLGESVVNVFLPPTLDATPESGVVLFLDDNGSEWRIDFLRMVAGVKDDKLHKLAILVEATEADGTPLGVEFRVMHPLLCLMSRAYNIVRFDKYKTEHAFRQYRASIPCLREFMLDLLVDGTYVRDVLRLTEQIVDFCSSRLAITAMELGGADPFDSLIADDPRLPPEFRELRYPQLREKVFAKRERLKRANAIRLAQKQASLARRATDQVPTD